MRKGETMMKIIAINPIPFKKRMIEFLFDYLFILAYLVLLFLSSMLIYIIFIIQECEKERDWQNRGEKYKPLRLNFCKLWDAIKKDDVNKHRT